MWRIPTQGRYGCGDVCSDAHSDTDAAQAEIEAALGHRIEPRRDIPIDAGRLRDVWRGNCVVVGVASSFLEPLEATSIHGTIGRLMLLRQWIDDPGGRARYNDTVARQVDDYHDFIRLHCASERRDTPFAGGPPHVEEQLYLLDRAGARAALANDPRRRAHLRKIHAGLVPEYRRAAARCVGHRAYLKGSG